MSGNLVILHTVFITTEQFGHIETQITKKKPYIFHWNFLKDIFLKLLNCISGENQSSEEWVKALYIWVKKYFRQAPYFIYGLLCLK